MQPDSDQHASKERFANLRFLEVPWYRSLYMKAYAVIGITALAVGVATLILTSWVHRSVLEPYLTAEQVASVSPRILGVLIVVGIGAVVLSNLIAWVFASNYTRPIIRMRNAMDKLVHADFDVAIKVTRRDEFGSLFVFFNSMAAHLREAEHHNKAISDLKSQFVSTAAHQLRTPLTSIRWSLLSLQEGAGGTLTKQQQDDVHMGVEMADSMLRLINQLLKVAEVEEGKFSNAFQKIDVTTFSESLVKEYAQLAHMRNVTVEVKNNVRSGLGVVGDVAQLKLALGNILENAIQYSKEGGTVIMSLQQAEKWLRIEVIDTGIGIPEDEMPKMTTKFFRASNAQTFQPNGNGLGLYIVANVVKNHGGRFRIKSVENRGTTITLTLPLYRELIPKESLAEGIAAL